MRISNLLPLIGAVVLCANICVGAEDNAAQAAARAALMQKMSDLDSQQNEPSNQPSAPVPVETQPAPPPSSEPVAPAATAEPPAPPVEAAPVAPEVQPAIPASVEAQPEMPATSSAPVVAAPISVTNSVNPSEPPLNVEAQNAQPTNPPPALNEMPVPPPASQPPLESVPRNYAPVRQLSSHEMNYPGKKLGFKPIEPPPAPVSSEKEAALQTLLDQYKADQITPEQYQIQRAEILNAP